MKANDNRSMSPMRQMLKDLPTPPPLAEAIGENCRRFGFYAARDRLYIEEEIKLQYYYGGQDVACLDTPQGRMVVAAGIPGTGAIRKALDNLLPEERRRAVIISLDPWDEEDDCSTPPGSLDEAQNPPGPPESARD